MTNLQISTGACQYLYTKTMSTKSHKLAQKRGPGRPATGQSPVLSLRLPVGLMARLDAVLDTAAGERRRDLAISAIEREIARRERRAT